MTLGIFKDAFSVLLGTLLVKAGSALVDAGTAVLGESMPEEDLADSTPGPLGQGYGLRVSEAAEGMRRDLEPPASPEVLARALDEAARAPRPGSTAARLAAARGQA